jgi:predicted PurR-regulated permease PerM
MAADSPDLDRREPLPDRATAGLIERSIALLIVLALFAGVLAVLRPFATAILFGATLAIAGWPLRQRLVKRGFGQRSASFVLLVISLFVLAIPVLVAAPVLTEQVGQGVESLKTFLATMPSRPPWLAAIPFVGDRIAQTWDELVRTGDFAALVTPYSSTLQHKLVGAARALTDSLVQLVLSLIVATMFWVSGGAIADQLRDVVVRLGGAAAERSLGAAADAVRSVAYGVVGTAVAQAILLAIGLAVAGVPGAMTLGFVGLLLAASQVGGPLLAFLWGGAAWWLFAQGRPGWGTFMIAWGVMVQMVDNILKPWLIGRGVKMPMSLTILGVFGGFVAFGFLGLFIGPTLIAVAFVLVQAWQGRVSNLDDIASPDPNR